MANGEHHEHFQLTMKKLDLRSGKSCKIIQFEEVNSCQDYLNALKTESAKEKTQECTPEELIFDRSIVKSSVTEDYQLVCNDAMLRYKAK